MRRKVPHRRIAVRALALGALTASLAGRSVIAAAVAPSPAAPPPRFMIRAFQVKGNRWLAPGRVEELVYPYMGPDRSADDVEKARAALQAEFEKQGYATVAVTIPEQGVETGIVRLDVEPQAIGAVKVTGTKKPDRVLAMAPSLASGTVPNFHDVQRDIVALNAAASRKVTPDVKAGVAPGTVDVTLRVERSSPFHATAEINNYKSPSTSDLRVGGSLRDDNVWGRGDSLTISAQTAPRRPRDGTVVSANYLAHLGRVQLLGYYVHSDSDIAVIGGTSVVGKGDLAGLRLIVPLSQSDRFYQSLTAGIDYKNFEENVLLGADRSTAPIEYFPVTAGWRGDWTATRAKSYLSFNATLGVRGWGDGSDVFANKRSRARPDFFLLKAEGASTVEVAKGFQAYAHAQAQWADNPLVSNEELSIGGIDTVRGYDESETLGDYGAAIQLEARSPKLLTKVPLLDELRVLAFYDLGYSAIRFPLPGQIDEYRLISVGGGVRAKVAHVLNGSVDIGVPLRTGPNSVRGDVFARFRIWGEF